MADLPIAHHLALHQNYKRPQEVAVCSEPNYYLSRQTPTFGARPHHLEIAKILPVREYTTFAEDLCQRWSQVTS